MIKVPAIVESLLIQDEIALGSFLRGQLNLSAYAHAIQKEVESRCKKPVKPGTITVALSRLQIHIDQVSIDQWVPIDQLIVKTPLTEYVYDKSVDTGKELQAVFAKSPIQSAEFFTCTYGTSELTLLFSSHLEQMLQGCFSKPPKIINRNLSALTIRFSKTLIAQPNILYSLLKRIALKRIVLSEIVSTYTELTFILPESELSKAIEAYKVQRI